MLRKLYFNLAYFQKPIWDSGISPPELMDFISSHSPGRAVEMGCGTGTNAITLAKAGWQVVGIDFAYRAIQVAKKKAQMAHLMIDFQVGDVTHLDLPADTYDLVLDIGCFHTLPVAARPNYIENINRLLAGAGTYLLYAFFTSSPGIKPGVTGTDVRFIEEHLKLVKREDGTERGIRPSAWLVFHKNSRHKTE